MKKKIITLFGSPHCPDCPPVIDHLEKNNVDYNYIDITASMKNLKTFLKFRDVEPFFDNAKKNGNVGIPTIMINDGEEFIVGHTDIDLEKLK